MPSDEAHFLMTHATFDRFYAEWDSAREKRGDPTPEYEGAMEAREQFPAIHAAVELERRMKEA